MMAGKVRSETLGNAWDCQMPTLTPLKCKKALVFTPCLETSSSRIQCREMLANGRLMSFHFWKIFRHLPKKNDQKVIFNPDALQVSWYNLWPPNRIFFTSQFGVTIPPPPENIIPKLRVQCPRKVDESTTAMPHQPATDAWLVFPVVNLVTTPPSQPIQNESSFQSVRTFNFAIFHSLGFTGKSHNSPIKFWQTWKTLPEGSQKKTSNFILTTGHFQLWPQWIKVIEELFHSNPSRITKDLPSRKSPQSATRFQFFQTHEHHLRFKTGCVNEVKKWMTTWLFGLNHSECRKTICFWICRLDIFIYTCSIYYAITFPFWTYYIPLDFWTSLTCTPFPSLEAPGSCWWVQQRHLHHIRPSLRNVSTSMEERKQKMFSSQAPSSWWHLLFFTKKKTGHPTVFPSITTKFQWLTFFPQKSSTANIVSGRIFFHHCISFCFKLPRSLQIFQPKPVARNGSNTVGANTLRCDVTRVFGVQKNGRLQGSFCLIIYANVYRIMYNNTNVWNLLWYIQHIKLDVSICVYIYVHTY